MFWRPSTTVLLVHFILLYTTFRCFTLSFYIVLDLSEADIHAVVKEIAVINSVDLLKIRNMLLEKWICKTGPAAAKVSLYCT